MKQKSDFPDLFSVTAQVEGLGFDPTCAMSNLHLKLEGTFVHQRIKRLFSELDAAGFRYFKPECYLGDEWFCPDGVVAISIPFYLADPRLIEIERRAMGTAEGENLRDFMQYIRHEAGHCFDHAYKIRQRRDFRTVFGDSKRKYHPEHYLADPKSKDFVINLPENYAQAHPDEDFAETFAVWLDPGSNWANTYRSWPNALAKLNYVDDLAHRFMDKRPIKKDSWDSRGRKLSHHDYAVSRLRRSLKRHYEMRLKL